MYAGFLGAVVFWPITLIVVKNDSFRILSNWTPLAAVILVLWSFLFPLLILLALDFLLERFFPSRILLFRHLILLLGGAILWVQFVYYHFNAFVRGIGIGGELFRYHSVWIVGLVVVWGFWKLRKYLATFFTYCSVLAILAVIFLFIILPVPARTSVNVAPSSIGSTIKSPASFYFIVFDGILLIPLLEGNQIN